MNGLEQNIMEALAGNPRVDPDEISVAEAFGGDVMLRGTVGSVVQREDAVRTTRHVTMRASDIDVAVRDSTVTLSGLVDLASQRDRTERDALAVRGIASVHNRLRVVFPSRPTTWPSASPTRSASARSSDGRDRRSAARSRRR